VEQDFNAVKRVRQLRTRYFIAYPPGHRLGLIINQPFMAWRPYENLIDGELDNRTPGKVVGWMRFYRRGKHPLRVTFDLDGDFHEDIRGKEIRLSNAQPSRDKELDGERTDMEGFARVQRGAVGDITAGLPLGTWTEELAQNLIEQHEVIWQKNLVPEHEREERRQELVDAYQKHIKAQDLYYPYVHYPYIEWYSENGRVVLELDPSQVEIFDMKGVIPRRAKSPAELVEDRKKRNQAFDDFMSAMVKGLSEENRRKGGEGNVTGIVVG
jgi:hypothetical protein